jgi:hypothetical protein
MFLDIFPPQVTDAMTQRPVLLEVEAHVGPDDPFSLFALQVELHGAAVEYGHVAPVDTAMLR